MFFYKVVQLFWKLSLYMIAPKGLTIICVSYYCNGVV